MKKHNKRRKARVRDQSRQAPDSLDHDGHVSYEMVSDPLTGYEASLRAIQGYQALKSYICPECNDVIEKGATHFVVVPNDAPDLRRHWHHYCWVRRRQNRLPVSKAQRKNTKR